MKAVWFDDKVLAAVKTIGEEAIKESCVAVTANVRDSMIEGTGRMWPSKVPGQGLHQASVPGVPPAPDTGDLQGSISWVTSGGESGGAESGDSKITPIIYGNNIQAIFGRVGTTNDNGVRHELGLTWYSTKRPFLRPQLKQNTSEILNIFKKYLGK